MDRERIIISIVCFMVSLFGIQLMYETWYFSFVVGLLTAGVYYLLHRPKTDDERRQMQCLNCMKWYRVPDEPEECHQFCCDISCHVVWISRVDVYNHRLRWSEDIKKKAMLSIFEAAFPLYYVRLESTNETPTLGVGVFNVPKDRVRAVNHRICELSEKFEDDYELLPMVRDIETTKEYYPQFKEKE